MIDRRPETLLAAEALSRGLDTDMAEQELNLFQFTARDVTQARAGAPKVMGRNVAEIGSGRKFPDYVEYDIGTRQSLNPRNKSRFDFV